MTRELRMPISWPLRCHPNVRSLTRGEDIWDSSTFDNTKNSYMGFGQTMYGINSLSSTNSYWQRRVRQSARRSGNLRLSLQGA